MWLMREADHLFPMRTVVKNLELTSTFSVSFSVGVLSQKGQFMAMFDCAVLDFVHSLLISNAYDKIGWRKQSCIVYYYIK
jgi:ACT domain-containing protein